MLLQPCLRAQLSAAASGSAPAPRLRCPSATMSPFTAARVAASSRGGFLTCSQAIAPPAGESATNTACCAAVLIPSSLLRISAAVAGYPSWPVSAAICGASAILGRRILSSSFFPVLATVIKLLSAAAALARRHSSIPAALPLSSSAQLLAHQSYQNFFPQSTSIVTGPSLTS